MTSKQNTFHVQAYADSASVTFANAYIRALTFSYWHIHMCIFQQTCRRLCVYIYKLYIYVYPPTYYILLYIYIYDTQCILLCVYIYIHISKAMYVCTVMWSNVTCCTVMWCNVMQCHVMSCYVMHVCIYIYIYIYMHAYLNRLRCRQTVSPPPLATHRPWPLR